MADKITVGNVDIVAVIDMVPPSRAPTMMFPTTVAKDWAPYQDALEESQLQLYYGHFFVRSQGKIIMVDTGMGPGPHPERGNRTGDLVNQLKLAGVGTDDVSFVVHTHLHADHVGWNVKISGGMPAPYFRRARYLVPRLDWEHFTRPEIIGSAPQVRNSVMPLQKLRLMDLVDGDHTITDEVKTLAAPGHTPGHQVIMISSQGEKAMIVGDLMHSKVQVQQPGWTPGVDLDKEASERHRTKLLELAEREGYVVAAGHFHPKDHIGKVVRLRGRRYWQAL
ncbi:MAG: MBL fold metallo-hydrolase [Chloroflexota bacterium]